MIYNPIVIIICISLLIVLSPVLLLVIAWTHYPHGIPIRRKKRKD